MKSLNLGLLLTVFNVEQVSSVDSVLISRKMLPAVVRALYWEDGEMLLTRLCGFLNCLISMPSCHRRFLFNKQEYFITCHVSLDRSGQKEWSVVLSSLYFAEGRHQKLNYLDLNNYAAYDTKKHDEMTLKNIESKNSWKCFRYNFIREKIVYWFEPCTVLYHLECFRL